MEGKDLTVLRRVVIEGVVKGDNNTTNSASKRGIAHQDRLLVSLL